MNTNELRDSDEVMRAAMAAAAEFRKECPNADIDDVEWRNVAWAALTAVEWGELLDRNEQLRGECYWQGCELDRLAEWLSKHLPADYHDDNEDTTVVGCAIRAMTRQQNKLDSEDLDWRPVREALGTRGTETVAESAERVARERDTLRAQLDGTSDESTSWQNRINRQRDLIVGLHETIDRLTSQRDRLQSRIDASTRLVNEYESTGHISLTIGARLRSTLAGLGKRDQKPTTPPHRKGQS